MTDEPVLVAREGQSSHEQSGRVHGSAVAETASAVRFDVADEELRALRQRGGRRSFARFYDLTAAAVYARALHTAAEPLAAREATIEAYRRAWHHSDHLARSHVRVLPWMLITAAHLAAHSTVPAIDRAASS